MCDRLGRGRADWRRSPCRCRCAAEYRSRPCTLACTSNTGRMFSCEVTMRHLAAAEVPTDSSAAAAGRRPRRPLTGMVLRSWDESDVCRSAAAPPADSSRRCAGRPRSSAPSGRWSWWSTSTLLAASRWVMPTCVASVRSTSTVSAGASGTWNTCASTTPGTLRDQPREALRQRVGAECCRTGDADVDRRGLAEVQHLVDDVGGLEEELQSRKRCGSSRRSMAMSAAVGVCLP